MNWREFYEFIFEFEWNSSVAFDVSIYSNLIVDLRLIDIELRLLWHVGISMNF